MKQNISYKDSRVGQSKKLAILKKTIAIKESRHGSDSDDASHLSIHNAGVGNIPYSFKSSRNYSNNA